MLVLFMFISLAMVLSSCSKASILKKEFCSYDFQVQDQYATENTCFQELLKLQNIREENNTSIMRELSLDSETKEKLEKYNDEEFTELATKILDNTTVELDFSNAEIIKTFIDDGYLIGCVGDHYNEAKYKYAFSAFLTYFRDDTYGTVDSVKYEYDCVYYICNTLYPKTFNQGIIDTFLSIGISSWGTSGAETLDETISYVSSSPEGKAPYESYITKAKKQLAEKNAIEDSKPKHYCVECGTKASYSYKSPFSGQTEWYCVTCYRELQELLGQFGMN